MKQILLIVFLFGIANSFSQSKKFFRYFKDYTRLDASSNYPVSEQDPRAIFNPSITYAGDTSGLKFNNEYVAFRQEHVTGLPLPTSYFRFIHSEPTTVAEYSEFQNYLRDSVCREVLYEQVKDDKEAAKMLLIRKQFIAEMDENPENRPKDFGYNDRKDNRYYFDLNWKYPLMPEKGWQASLLRDYYLLAAEQFYGKREFDWRKLTYSYSLIDLRTPTKKSDTLIKRSRQRFIIDYESPIIINPFAWSSSSKSVNDETSVLGQLYTDLFPDQPITGITGMQALAFCDWKKQQIEKELAKQGLPCYVTVTLPTVADLERMKSKQQFEVPERDYTEQWRITGKEYKDFVKAVKDSLELELLYANIPSDEDAAMLLNHPKEFYNEIESEMVPFKVSKREQNRLFFPLKYDASIIKKYQDLLPDVKSSGWNNHCYYRYFWMDAAAKGFEPKLTPGPENMLFPEYYETAKQQQVESKIKGSVNDRNQHSGVRVFSNLQAFIIPELTDVILGISLDNQEDTELMKGITYEQAKAFYSWKYPIQKAKAGDNWQQFIFPNKEQFELLQKGEKMVIPAHKLDFPAPTFHYVVHLSRNFYMGNTGKIKLR